MCYYSQLIKNPKYTPNKKNGGVVPYMAIRFLENFKTTSNDDCKIITETRTDS